jgi:succinylglutamate desuccinylase
MLTPHIARIPRLSTERLIGLYTQNREGNMVLVFGGVHGNEPSGVRALQAVFAHLDAHRPSFRGSIIGIAGNPPALAAGVRYLQHDLNRLFDPRQLAARRQDGEEPLSAEESEAIALMELVERLMQTGLPSARIFVDLHATSAPGGGFSVIRDSEANRAIAARLHLPLVFGIETKLHATLMNYLYAQGLNGVIFEAGQIGTRDALEVHTAGIWTLLAGLGCIHPKDVPDYRYQVNRMIDAAEKLPKAVRAVYRHSIVPQDAFTMHPGFVNFQPVSEGQELAVDRTGPVLAPRDGLLIMPLYQEQGSEGFFLCEPVDY